ncbi:MAG TPA: hypothetical protein VMW87_14300 [Spirochaetia bacterium]|nr:hypothetical protein [Spirochaetia bacterium]
MNQKLGRQLSYVLSFLCLLIFLSGCLLFIFPAADSLFPGSTRETSWRGYFSLLVGDDASDSLVTNALTRAGIAGVVSSSSTLIDFNDISRITSVPVSGLSERLDPADPRLDPFMTGVSAYFHTVVDGRKMQILYLPARSMNILRLNGLVHRALDAFHIDWYLLEWNGLRQTLFIVSFVVFVGLLVFRTRRHRALVAAGALPWLAGVLTGGYGGFAASCVLVFAWAYFVEEAVPSIEKRFEEQNARAPDSDSASASFWTRELGVRAGFYAVALAVALLLRYDAVSGAASLPGLVPGLTATAAFSVLGGSYLRRRAATREHPIFLPRRILQPTVARALRGVYGSAVPLLLILVMLPPVVLLAIPSGAPVHVPRPVPVAAAHGLGWDALARLWQKRKPDSLPDLSVYLAHRAYQDTFLYQTADVRGGGSAFRFPSPGETVDIPGYSFDGLRVTEHPRVMFTYTKDWYRDQLSGHNGIVGLLLAQGRPVEVMEKPAGRVFGDAAVLLRHAGVVLLLFLPFLISLMRLTVRLRHGLRDTIVRRKKIEA